MLLLCVTKYGLYFTPCKSGSCASCRQGSGRHWPCPRTHTSPGSLEWRSGSCPHIETLPLTDPSAASAHTPPLAPTVKAKEKDLLTLTGQNLTILLFKQRLHSKHPGWISVYCLTFSSWRGWLTVRGLASWLILLKGAFLARLKHNLQ